MFTINWEKLPLSRENISLPSSLGQGQIEHFEFRDRLQVLSAQLNLNQPQQILKHNPEKENLIELIFCLQGRFKENDVWVNHLDKAIMISTPSVSHIISLESQMDISLVIVLIPREFFRTYQDLSSTESSLQKSILEKNNWHTHLDAHPAMDICLQQFLEPSATNLSSTLYKESKIIEVLSLLLDHQHNMYSLDTLASNQESEKMTQALKIIQQHFHQKLSIRELAKSVGTSETKFKSNFKKFYKTSPYQYIIKLRLEKASNLLRESTYTVSEISAMVGYNSLSHFVNIFKKIYGAAPLDYRRAVKQNIKK